MVSPESALSRMLADELLAPGISENEPGAIIAIYRDGALLAHAARGVADTRSGEPLTIRTLMNIASVSKQIVAAAVLSAAERGELDLDSDIRVLVPEVALPGITVRGCLTHTSGLPDYFAVSHPAGVPEIEIAGLDRFLGWLGTVRAGDFAPGTSQSYSNTGYVVAALAAERASGVPFPDLIRDTVFAPLGMGETFVTTMLGEFRQGMAMSYERGEDGSFALESMGIGEVEPVRGVNGDGEVITSVAEFGAWHGFLLDGRGLGTGVRERLLQRTVLSDGQVSNYALGIEHETVGGVEALGHSGGMWGFRSHSLVEPSSGLSVVCFANNGDVDAQDLAWRALRVAKGERELAGRWFSSRFAKGVTLSLHGTSELVLVEGVIGAEEVRLQRSSEGRWVGPGCGVAQDGAALRVATWAGVGERYERLRSPGEAPLDAVGDYREPNFGAILRIDRDPEGGLSIFRDGHQAVEVTPFGEREGEWIGESSLGWVLIPLASDREVRLGTDTCFVALERVETR